MIQEMVRYPTSEEVDFGVSELQDPYRIVIDVAHP